MSSPATSCSRRYTDNASTYCSRNRLITIASRNDLIPRFSVYQLGRGSDPVIVVGNTVPAVAFSIERGSFGLTAADAKCSGGQPEILSESINLAIWRFSDLVMAIALSKPSRVALFRVRDDRIAHEHRHGHR